LSEDGFAQRDGVGRNGGLVRLARVGPGKGAAHEQRSRRPAVGVDVTDPVEKSDELPNLDFFQIQIRHQPPVLLLRVEGRWVFQELMQVGIPALLRDLRQIGCVVGAFTEQGVAIGAVLVVPHPFAGNDLGSQLIDVGQVDELPVTIQGQTQENQRKNLLQYVNAQDIRSFGLIPELLGRLPVITYLNPLDASTLRDILTEPKNSLIKQYTRLFEMEGIKLIVDEETLEFMVQKALEFKLGARGLRSICEHILTDAMFEMPGSNKKELHVTLEYATKKFDKSKLNKLKVA